MPQTLESFIKGLSDSGIMSADEATALSSQTGADSAVAFADALVHQSRITKFQADVLSGNTDSPLVISNYELLSKLGEGGMGQVFRARHRTMKREVALKILPSAKPQMIERFQREVEASAKLIHPNIVTAYDAGEDSGTHFLTMECVQGSDLARWIKEHGPARPTTVLGWIKQAAEGLQYAHERGVIHRDIKPSNLLLSDDGQIKILDMGLARLTDNDVNAATQAELTANGTVMGTVAFMSPEQARNTKQVDARSDIYSLGCTLYNLLTGIHVFRGDSPVAICMSHQNDEPPTLPNASMNSIFQRMVEKNPADRYQSMEELISDIDQAMPDKNAGLSTVAMPAVDSGGRLTGPWLIGSIVAVTVIAFGCWWTMVKEKGIPIAPKHTDEPAETNPVEAVAERNYDDEIARRFLNLSATVQILVDGKERTVESVADLPEQYSVVGIIAVKTDASDDDLKDLSRLESLRSLYLAGTNVTDGGMPHIKGCTKLGQLGIGQCEITNDGLTQISKVPLHHLHLGRVTGVDDSCVDTLLTFAPINQLIVNDTGLTEDGLRRLKAKHGIQTGN